MSAAKNGRPQHALHEHYSFLDPDLHLDGRAQFIELVRDLSSGLALCVELIHSSNLTRAAGEGVPLLGENDAERLARLAIVSANQLKQAADNNIEFLNELVHQKRAPKE